MIKVCFISPSFPYMNCGVGDYTLELVKSLRDFGIEIGVITSIHEKIKQFMKDSSIEKVTLFPIIKRWNFGNISILLKKINNLKPDIIHIQYHCGSTSDGFIIKGLMAVFLPLILKVSGIKKPIFVTLHSRLNGPYLFPKAGFLRQLALLPLVLFSDKIIVTNKFDGRKLSGWLPFLKKKINYIAGGTGHYLSDKDFKEESLKIKSQLKDSDNEVMLSNFGFMVPYKGIEELLEAMHILIKKGYSLKLLAIGGFDTDFGLAGPYFAQLQKKAEALNIEPYIRWMGFCEPIRASLFLLASDICVMPFRDGASEWRSSFLDAISHGLPVITTYTERTPEELKDKVNCLLVPPKDSQRLAAAIEKLIKSPVLRESLGKAARELYQKEYNWPIIAKKTVDNYRDELKRRRYF